jgi:hypothetical protein
LHSSAKQKKLASSQNLRSLTQETKIWCNNMVPEGLENTPFTQLIFNSYLKGSN